MLVIALGTGPADYLEHVILCERCDTSVWAATSIPLGFRGTTEVVSYTPKANRATGAFFFHFCALI